MALTVGLTEYEDYIGSYRIRHLKMENQIANKREHELESGVVAGRRKAAVHVNYSRIRFLQLA